jgi:predicted MFS family arabinose efflux permease
MGIMALARYHALFREQRAFGRFWAGFVAAVTADEIMRIGFVWFVYAQTGSAAAVGWLMVCFTAPILIGGAVAGWVLDRFDRRLAMVIDNLVRAVVVALVPLLHVLDLLTPTHLYAIATVFGLLMMIPLAGTPTLIPALVPVERRQTANALEVLGYTVGGVVGAALGGVLIAAWGAPAAVLVSATSYVLFAWTLARLPPQPPASVTSRRAPIGPSLGLLLNNAFLRATTAMYFVFNIGLGLLLTCLPVFVDTRLAAGASGYGLILAAFAAGQMTAALLVGALAPDGRLGLRICVVQALAGLCVVAVWPLSYALPAAGALFVFGLMVAPLTVWAQTLRMGIVPPALHGRTFALLRTLMQAGRPVGGAIAGLMLEPQTLTFALLLAAALIGLPGLAGLLVRELRAARPPHGP